jgi:hypothetical protein
LEVLVSEVCLEAANVAFDGGPVAVVMCGKNKFVAYLSAVERRLDDTLSVVSVGVCGVLLSLGVGFSREDWDDIVLVVLGGIPDDV